MKSQIVLYRRIEDEFGNPGVKFIRINRNGERETRTYHYLSYSSYWRMIRVTGDLYDRLCKESEELQFYLCYNL